MELAQQLLGQKIITHIDGKLTSGMIVETEAYQGPEDKASHAYLNRRTPRTETMFAPGGVLYVYLCYGIHSLVNIVTGPKDVPHAVLIRAIEPLEGLEVMLKRRKMHKVTPKLTSGPGCLSQALGLNCSHDGVSLDSSLVWIEKHKTIVLSNQMASSRVGIAYAKEHQHLPWRFRIKNNPWTSPAA